MAVPESQIPPPKFILAAKMNQVYTDYHFSNLVQNHLWPLGLDVAVTSSFRDADHNADVGGALNSAHLHGLAKDFVITRGGRRVPLAEEKQVFASVVKPNWPGYALHEGDHIHVDLSRTITPATATLSFLVVGAVAVPVFKTLLKMMKKG